MEEMEMRLRRRLAITIVCFIVQFVMVMWLNIANHRAVVSLIEAQCGGESAKAVESETEAEKPVDGSDGIIAGADGNFAIVEKDRIIHSDGRVEKLVEKREAAQTLSGVAVKVTTEIQKKIDKCLEDGGVIDGVGANGVICTLAY